jgi:hypothetical protein
MTRLFRLFAIWGLLDAAWLLADPASWARFWGRFVAEVGRRAWAARALGAVDALLCLYLWRGGGPTRAARRTIGPTVTSLLPRRRAA